MTKRALLIVGLLVLSQIAGFSDIGEDFAAGGWGLSGSIALYNNFYYFQDSADTRKNWSINVAPGVSYFLADKVDLQVLPFVFYSEFASDPNNITRQESWGLNVGISYAFVSNPTAQQGFVPAIGAFIGFSVFPSVTDVVSGAQVPQNSWTQLQLTLVPRLYYFFNDRVAAFLTLNPTLYYVINYVDANGNPLTLADNQKLSADITVRLGITYFIPNQKASLFGNTQERK